MKRQILALLVAGVVTLLAAPAAGEPLPEIQHFNSPSRIVTDGGTDLRLPPGYFLPDPVWDALDLEVKRLQTAETRLEAENKSLRASAEEGPGWGTLLIIGGAVASGFAAGAYFR